MNLPNLYVMCPLCSWVASVKIPQTLEDACNQTLNQKVCRHSEDLIFTTGAHVPLLATLSYVTAPVALSFDEETQQMHMSWFNESIQAVNMSPEMLYAKFVRRLIQTYVPEYPL